MPTDSLFRRVDAEGGRLITLTFDDQAFQVPSGLTVAAALLLAGVRQFRTSPVGGEARAPYCMMGVCFECLVEIDGVPSRQSCLIEAVDGMRIRSQQGAREVPFTATDAVVLEVQP